MNLEIRKQVLELLGWTVEIEKPKKNERWGMTNYYLKTPRGRIAYHTVHGAEKCWENAPAIETDLGLAERFLLRGVQWKIQTVENGGYYVDIEKTIHSGGASFGELAEIICRQYLVYRGVFVP